MLVQLLPLSALYWLSNGHASEKIIKEKQLRKVDKPIRQSALRDFIFCVIVICALHFPTDHALYTRFHDSFFPGVSGLAR